MPGHSQRGDVPWLSIDGYSWYGTFHGGRIFNSFKISTYKNSLILWVMCLILDGRERDGFLVGPRWIQCNQRISLNYHECLSMVTCWDCRYIIYVICHSMYSHIWMCIWYMCILIIYIYISTFGNHWSKFATFEFTAGCPSSSPKKSRSQMCSESRCLGPATMCLTLYLGYALTGELFHSSRCCMLRLEPGYQKHDTDSFWQPFWGKDWWIFELVSQTLSPTSFLSIITQDHIWKVAGYEAMQKKTNTPDDFSFDKCPRALMFERARHSKESWQSCDVSCFTIEPRRVKSPRWWQWMIFESYHQLHVFFSGMGQHMWISIEHILCLWRWWRGWWLNYIVIIDCYYSYSIIVIHDHVVDDHDSWWIGLNGDVCSPFTSMWRWPPHT